MKTKYLVRFLNRLAHYEADLELVDILKKELQAGKLNPELPCIFDAADATSHPRLFKRKASDHNRAIALNHLQKTVRASFIKDVYEDVTKYLSDLIRGAAAKGLEPGRLIGEHKLSLSCNDVLQCHSFDEILDLVASNLFRRLENEQSTVKLLKAVNNKLGLGVEESLINEALPYLELRHLLVHSDGIADARFSTKYTAIRSKAGKKVNLTHALTGRASTKISSMIKEFDRLVIEKEAVLEADCQP
jgi:hypothetical protein